MSNENVEQILDVQLTCEGQATGKMRNELKVTGSWNPDHPWQLATDEGPFHGGDSTAPPPLALFCASVTGCFMTQVRAFAKKLRIPIASLKVTGSFKWQAVTHPQRPYVSSPRGFGLDIEIDSSATPEQLKELIAAAKRGCFLEQTLIRPNAIDHRMKLDGRWVEV